VKKKNCEAGVRDSLGDPGAFFQAWAETAPEIFFIIDQNLRLTYTNPFTAGLLNKKPHYLVGKHLKELFPPEDLAIQRRNLKRVFHSGVSHYHEDLFHFPGQALWLGVRLVPLRDSRGKITAVLGVARDNTARKFLETNLEESERKYRSLVENIPGVVYIGSAKNPGELLYVSPRIQDLLGFSPEEWLADWKIWLERLQAKDRHRLYKGIKGAAKTATPFIQEYCLTNRKGETVWVYDQAYPVKDERGKLLYFQGMVIDISRRKKAEENLAKTEERYRTLFEATEDGVVITTEEGRILALNQACRRLFGIPQRASLKKLSVPDFYVNPQDRQTYIRTMKRKGFVSNYEIAYRKTDGSSFAGTLTATLQNDSEGRPIFMGIIRDITQRKRQEIELRQSRRELRNLSEHLHTLLEEEKKRISRRIHDELGQQLTAFKMDLYWLNRHFFDPPSLLSEKVGSMSQILDNTIHTVQNLCEELRPALLDNLGLIDALEWQINSFRERTGLEILWNVSPRNLNLSQENATLIFRLFQEAMNNIFLHARASRVIITLKKNANLVKFTIRDNGLGITEAQINSPRSFGLLGMRERVDARGGQIKIRGLAGKGTEVAIKIPLSKKEQRHD
jgi:PAS domain S-box-containing protein